MPISSYFKNASLMSYVSTYVHCFVCVCCVISETAKSAVQESMKVDGTLHAKLGRMSKS